ncbi:MAG: DUF4838 domain-containing protein [Candidatus Rokubacteria bacterium]|nr:DUF4838 domain-containing protein [Candidatus Rokubacteria bacterium]
MRPLVLALAILVLSAVAGRADAIVLVRDGRPAATIVIRDAAFRAAPAVPARNVAGDPDAKIKLAALELQRYVRRISGAELAIASDAQPVTGAAVLVGPSRRTEAFGVAIPDGLTPERVEEGFVIVARGDTLLLAGNDAGPYYGSYYAVADFLHRLGVRWYMPGAFGEIVPARATIALDDVEARERPSFRLRTWWSHMSPEMEADELVWKLRNKMQIAEDQILAIPRDSSLRAFLPADLLATRPDYFARRADGTVDPHFPNLSSAEAARVVAQRLKAAIGTRSSIGFAPDDGTPADHRPESLALSQRFTDLLGRDGVPADRSISEEWFAFVNRVAAEVAKDHPRVIVTTNGYANRHLPPEGLSLHPSLSVMFAAIWADTIKPLDAPNSWHGAVQARLIRRWTELNRRVWIYGYTSTMLVSALTPVPTVRRVARMMRELRDRGVVGFLDETRQAYMEHGIPTYYLRARLEWNADLDVGATLEEFYRLWYGPAAAPARAFWDAIEDRLLASPLLGHEDRILPYVYTDELVATLERHVTGAEQRARAERHRRHVAVDRHVLEHLKAYRAMHAAEFAADWAEAVRQADVMFHHRRALHTIDRFFYTPETKDERTRYRSAWYWNLTDRRALYESLRDRTSGRLGTLVALAPRTAAFRLDPADIGTHERWHAPDHDRRAWRALDGTVPYYAQGLLDARGVPQHRGAMWYAFEVDVPASVTGRPVWLFAPAVVTEAWVWIDGRYVGHRPYVDPYIRPAPLHFDVTRFLTPGRKNLIAVRVHTGMNLTQAADGFQGRLLLYAPNPPR